MTFQYSSGPTKIAQNGTNFAIIFDRVKHDFTVELKVCIL